MSKGAAGVGKLLIVALSPVFASGVVCAAEQSDFEKKVAALGKDARPKQLNVQVTIEEKEKGLVVGKGEGAVLYDAEAGLLVAHMKAEKASTIEDGKVVEWHTKGKKDFLVSKDGGVAMSERRVRAVPAGTVVPVVSAEGMLNKDMEQPMACLLGAHGLDALLKICRLEPSERKEAGVVWAKVVIPKGATHQFLNHTNSRNWSLELAVNESSGMIQELVEKRDLAQEGEEKAVSTPLETRVRFTYEKVPDGLAEQLKAEIAKALEALPKTPAKKEAAE